MIKVENLKKSYSGRTVVDIPSLTLKGGEIVGLTGRNGAGKTTLLRLMLALTKLPHPHGVFPLHRPSHWAVTFGLRGLCGALCRAA